MHNNKELEEKRMFKMLKKVKNQKGMTLVELLAVMVIVGIIAAISIPAIGGMLDNTRKDAHVANVKNIGEAARLFVSSTEDMFNLYFNDTTTNGDKAIYKYDDATDTWNPFNKSGETDELPVFSGYIDNLKDPHTEGKYAGETTYFEITRDSNNNYQFAVYLDGAKVDVYRAGSSNSKNAVNINEVTRNDVH